MATDIDRLHDVVTGRRCGRGCGKTVAVCHLIAGHIELGRSGHIHILLTRMRDLDNFLPLFFHVCDEHKIELRRGSRHGDLLLATPSWTNVAGRSDVTVRFYSESDADHLTPGHFPAIDARQEAVGDWIDYELWKTEYDADRRAFAKASQEIFSRGSKSVFGEHH